MRPTGAIRVVGRETLAQISARLYRAGARNIAHVMRLPGRTGSTFLAWTIEGEAWELTPSRLSLARWWKHWTGRWVFTDVRRRPDRDTRPRHA